MDIEAMQKRLGLARKLKATIENQGLLLHLLAELQQHLWYDEGLREECTSMQRELSRKALKTARQWMDLSDSEDRRDKRAAETEAERAADDLPL